MSREKDAEVASYTAQGKDHAERGIDCPPSDRLNEVLLRGLTNETTIKEADAAYQNGKSNAR